MGYDGGIRITRISKLKKDWLVFKEQALEYLVSNFKQNNYSDMDGEKVYALLDAYPNDISDLSNDEILDLFSIFKFCDTPFIIDDLLITACGDYIGDNISFLSNCLWEFGTKIETWT